VPVVGWAMLAVGNGWHGCVEHYCVGLGVYVVACTSADMQLALGLADMRRAFGMVVVQVGQAGEARVPGAVAVHVQGWPIVVVLRLMLFEGPPWQ
jgi:hypothetical protein